MKFRTLVSAAIGAILAVSSARAGIFDIPVLIKPAAAKIKTVAVISAYMNSDFYDVKSPKTGGSIELIKNPDKSEEQQPKLYGDLLDYSVKACVDRFNGLGGWKWIPVQDVISNPAYAVFKGSFTVHGKTSGILQKIEQVNESGWITAQGMARVPADSVPKTGKVVYLGGSKDPATVLAQLCRDLNVDAVAILQFDMAYRKLITGADIFSGIPGAPSVSAELVIVNRDGETAADSGAIKIGEGRRFEGKSATMLRQSRVHLDDGAIASYHMAVDKAADDIKKRLEKDFSKLK